MWDSSSGEPGYLGRGLARLATDIGWIAGTGLIGVYGAYGVLAAVAAIGVIRVIRVIAVIANRFREL